MIKKHNRLNTTISPAMGLGLLACIFILFSVVASVIASLLMSHMTNSYAAIRISIVLQDLFVFIIPAIATAIVITRLPARFLDIESTPKPRLLILAILSLLAAFPVLNCIISWNENLHLPVGFTEIESQLRALENAAEDTFSNIISSDSVSALILSILIVAILAGLSEELFFRGALQKLMLLTRMNPHVAIWITAFIFSTVHFQFFGFIPRMILGAYFGYLVWWTRCLWIPITVHIFNNSIVVISKWIEARSGQSCTIDTIGINPLDSTTSLIAITISILLTSYLLIILKKESK